MDDAAVARRERPRSIVNLHAMRRIRRRFKAARLSGLHAPSWASIFLVAGPRGEPGESECVSEPRLGRGGFGWREKGRRHPPISVCRTFSYASRSLFFVAREYRVGSTESIGGAANVIERGARMRRGSAERGTASWHGVPGADPRARSLSCAARATRAKGRKARMPAHICVPHLAGWRGAIRGSCAFGGCDGRTPGLHSLPLLLPVGLLHNMLLFVFIQVFRLQSIPSDRRLRRRQHPRQEATPGRNRGP